MEIRKKITLHFTLVVAILFLIALLVVYFSFSAFRRDEFKDRLRNRTKSVAQLIAETESVESKLLERFEKNNPTSLPKETIIVVNSQNKIIYSSGINPDTLFSETLIEKIRFEKSLYQRDKNSEIFGYSYSGNIKDVVVICSAYDLFGIRKLKKLRLILISTYFISLMLVFYLGSKFSFKALNPISEVVNQVNEIDVSNINKRVIAGSGKDEIAILAETFNKMLDRLEDAFGIQKDFIANASHELRTPLTAITGQIEVNLMQDRSLIEYKKVLSSVLEDIKGLNKLTNRLLVLLRAESSVVDKDVEVFRIDDVLWKSRAEILKRFTNYSVNMVFDESIDGEHHFQIIGNQELLKTAFINLIDNGCKYSSSNQIEVTLAANNIAIEIKFTDRGIGIPEKEIESVFQPFYRATNTTEKKGHGIGLSIAEKIIAIHKGTINISSVIHEGTTITLLFPLV